MAERLSLTSRLIKGSTVMRSQIDTADTNVIAVGASRVACTNSAVCAFEVSHVTREGVDAIAAAVDGKAERLGQTSVLILLSGAAEAQGEALDAMLRERLAHVEACRRYAIVGCRGPLDATASLWPRWFAAGDERRAWDFVGGRRADAERDCCTSAILLVA